MTRYKITLEYDGTDLIGWQQNHQGPSVQSILRDAIEKAENEIKKMCGLWHAHVYISEYNDFGKCGCIDCFGMSCHNCKTYKELNSQITEIFEKTKCDRCLGR